MKRTSLRLLASGSSILLSSVLLLAEAAEPVVSETVVPAPVEAVWSAYTTRAEIERWMVARSSEYELRIGGEWRTSYESASNLDDDTVIRNEILAFDPHRMLAIRTVETPADFPFPNAILDTWTIVYLEPLDERRTRVVTRMLGFDDTEEATEMRAFFEWGNVYELEKLVEHFQRSD